MALRGNLKDFSLPDVFQLVTFSRKSGVLRIMRADGAEGSVWFREGDVFFAQSNWHSELLGERLVRTQRITPQALERALALRQAEGEGGRRLGTILVAEGYITETVLEAFVSEQIQETIFDLMRWDEGDFDFEATPVIADEDIGLSVSIENVVMEGSRRLEEWTRIRKKIPSMDVVFKMATAPGEGTFEISLKPMEWNLLLLVDGTRTVAELAHATGRTDFEVARIIYGLFSAGLLEFATDAEVEKLRAERLKREAELARIDAARDAAAVAETAAAQEREAALETAAEERAKQATAPETPSGVSTPAFTEVPEFLSGPIAPSAEDAAVLAEMMGAVLRPTEAPVAPAPAAPAQPSPAPALAPEPETVYVPEAPSAEPEAAAAEPVSALDYEFPGADIPVAPVAEMPAEGIPLPPWAEPLAGGEEDAVRRIQASPTEPAEPQTPGEFEPSDDFASNLLALGLGELPDQAADEPSDQQLTEIIVPDREPSALTPPADWASVPAEPHGVTQTSEPTTFDSPGTDADLAEETPDFSDLLGSLDFDAAESHTARPETAADFDEDLLREVAPPAKTGGVISTDAFLEDIQVESLGFSGGMTDELSALTGLGGRTSRPTASVNKIPDAGAGDMLHRDTNVGRDTLLKIIDGIKNL